MIRTSFLSSAMIVAIGIYAFSGGQTVTAGGLGCINPKDCRCELSTKEVAVEKSCFEVECKTICIPKVVFPWQTGKGCFGLGLFGCSQSSCDGCDASICDGDGCDGSGCSNGVNNGAFTKTVKVLSKKKYTEPGTEYSWSVNKGSDCDAGCDTAQAASKSPAQRQWVAERQVPRPILNVAPVRIR